MKRRETSPCKYLSINGTDYSAKAAAVIGAGGIVAIPTETSYGLAVDPFNGAALARLFKVKQRPPCKPVLVLLDSIGHLSLLTSGLPPVYEPLINYFWPGPLTLIFPALPTLPSLLTAGTGTVGVRVSSNRIAGRVCQHSGGAITATSANISGYQPARSVQEINEIFGDQIDAVIDGGVLGKVPPSTIVSQKEGRLQPVREGAIPFSEIREIAS